MSFTPLVKRSIALAVRPVARRRVYLARPRRLWFAVMGLLVVIGCGASLSRTQSSQIEAALAEACVDSVDCRHLVQQSRRQLEDCSVGCSAERKNYQAARRQLRDALEREALAEHEQRKKDLQRSQSIDEARQAFVERERRDQRRETERADAERRHQRQLELLEAQRRVQRQKHELAWSKRVDYFQRLSPSQRSERLRTCHASAASAHLGCQELAEQLLQACGDDAESRRLLELNETLLATNSAETGSLNGAASTPVQRRAPRRAPRQPPVQCCDGTLSLTCSCGSASGECCADRGGSCGCAGS